MVINEPSCASPLSLHNLITANTGHNTQIVHLSRPTTVKEYATNTTPHLTINLLKAIGHVMHQQFDIQQMYVLPTLYLCVLYLSENKQRLVPLTA